MSGDATKALASIEFEGQGGLQIRTIDDLFRLADGIHKSGLAPRGLDTAPKILVAIQKGAEAGLSPLQSLSSIDVIEGVPCWKTNAALGMIRASGKLAHFHRSFVGEEGKDTFGCRVYMKRSDSGEEMEYTFTVADAKLAHLWGKKTKSGHPTPWILHPKRMLYARALGFCAKDLFPDVLQGWATREEVEEYATPPRNITPRRPELPTGEPDAALDFLDSAEAEVVDSGGSSGAPISEVPSTENEGTDPAAATDLDDGWAEGAVGDGAGESHPPQSGGTLPTQTVQAIQRRAAKFMDPDAVAMILEAAVAERFEEPGSDQALTWIGNARVDVAEGTAR